MTHSARTLDYNDFVHPASIAELEALVKAAYLAGEQVRVRGAMHSEDGSILGDGFSRNGAPRKVHQVMLDKLTAITIHPANGANGATRRVTVQAGASLGGDPLVPGVGNPQQVQATSLFETLHRAGLALPITGGISHQTVSGFLSTGSAGGSLLYSFQDAVQRVTLINGTGTPQTFVRGDAEFPAVLVSLGLLGILVEVELECTAPSYDVVGMRSTQAVCDCDVDLFADAHVNNSLVRFLTHKEYSRVVWWPQPGVDRVELWEAKRVAPGTTHPRPPSQSAGVISPALQLFARGLLAVAIESLLPRAGEGVQPAPAFVRALDRALQTLSFPLRFTYHLVDAIGDAVLPWSHTRIPGSLWKSAVTSLFKSSKPTWMPSTIVDGSAGKPRCKPASPSQGLTEASLAWLLKLFVKTFPYAQAPWQDDQGVVRRYAAELFADAWHIGLPMDNPVHDRALPVTFTEVWIPMQHAPQAMRLLRDKFAAEGFAATGTFCIELYAAKRSEAWISAAYGADVFRVDPFWFDDSDDIARQRFFIQFWETLQPFNARLHWGKALSPPGSSTGVAHRQSVLPQLNAFLSLRNQMDPREVFLTEYWKRHLGIP